MQLSTTFVPVTPDAGLWPILALPLVGAVLCGLFGRRLAARFGAIGVAGIAIAAMVGASVMAAHAWSRLLARPAGSRYLLDRVFPMIAIDSGAGRFEIDFALAFDPLSAVFVLVITIVGTLIHVYAARYMDHDEGVGRFFAYLNLFVFSMLLLVLGDSLILAFFGWEGVGLCSYLLIGFWYREPENGFAARKAFIVNRIGDLGFLAGTLLLFAAFSGALPGPRGAVLRETGAVITSTAPDAPELRLGPSLRFRELGALVAATDGAGRPVVAEALATKTLWGVPVAFLVCLAFFLAMSGKSAQIPLYVWLPDAMAGPTPVSALIHAATMVTAGVYLAARMWFLFALSPGACAVIAVIGAATALLGALLALGQYDIKKVLAYSTVSQLGFMFLAIGAGAPGAAVFHVVTHAAFKACLFLAAGSVIHALADVLGHGGHAASETRRRRVPDASDPQDLRNMGGLAAALPRTRAAYLVAGVALAGLPFASGFYSKDEILWRTLAASSPAFGPFLANLLFGVGLLTAGLTAFYIARSYHLAFSGTPPAHPGPAEAPQAMTVPVLVLAFGSIALGPLLGWPEAWGGHPALEHFLADTINAAPTSRFGAHPAGMMWAAQLASVAVAAAGWLGARALYRDRVRSRQQLAALARRCDGIHRALWNRLYVDELYNAVVVAPARDFSRLADWIDRRLVEGVLAGLTRLVRGFAVLGAALDRFLVDGLIDGFSATLLAVGRRLQKVQTGRLNHYTLGIALGAALLVVVAWIME
jgi:NADH:ubiquinone oxidoreductase subunit 5 (subunit L)/multisubunit Na+/H+ antiporter MnhA subunit